MKPALPYDPAAAVAHLRAADPVLAALIHRIGPFSLQLTPTRSLFEALLRSIVYQQLHGKAAASIHGRVLAELKKAGGPTPAAAAATSDEALRAAGLSRNKHLAVRDLAARCLDGTVPTLAAARKLPDDELITRLTAVRGIGPWTVHMLLLFHLGRPDVMPTGDFAIRLAFQRLYRRRTAPTPAAILRHARAWQPCRSVASWYLWRSLDTP
ncbi:DNA-3-methyladenine glycosylase 2 [Lacunisphaera limnophila]|uniref:DNA-3-methyladenine glycosylase II n=1 Tax=Lacunisphaera limnophila TaxID=1838286 RepID=A0A1D8AZF0_9BACT|nr:DNA-3-methyladenine glycosylase [Lacunisphaera limnophila]AOS46269.1 DNA-3-methyladenine glycosylase 2 [Lacunisphaera limnophila]